ncbi:hypothetical protein DEU56DRAFT_981006 [Suillus clintonianus]|uniref:uncharacterized protein n=1 Tax=Suillus clintonianus TaxID=1904413 RepID=UPI001B86CCE2|nr:uncharacterized protein DEU56DRAFT_981006 [Suillus clintonianus]KAG2135803.1 hypothetical protein DEU56DRAFT_981006 [Suillus clintonianus]
MVSPVQDSWGPIDESNEQTLKNRISRVHGEEGGLLNSALDIMLKTKVVATNSQIPVPGLPRMIDFYMESLDEGGDLGQLKWWKKLQNRSDWNRRKHRLNANCHAVFHLAHNTSFIVHAKADEVARAFVRRHRSFEGIYRESSPANTGAAAQTSSAFREEGTNANTAVASTLGLRAGGTQRITSITLNLAAPSEAMNFGGTSDGGAAVNPRPTLDGNVNGLDGESLNGFQVV